MPETDKLSSDKLFAGSIPRLYDDYLVPMIFAAYAEDLAGRIAARSPAEVLETAAGTGVLTRALARRLSPEAHYVVTDLNQPMLDLAAERQSEDARIAWRQADALALPFADEAFDTVACQFGAMFFPDKVKGYSEARRVLRPGGAFYFNLWDRIEDNHFAHEVTLALAGMFPEDPPRFLARTPHGHHDEARIRQDLKHAGFAQVSVERRREQCRAPSAGHAATAFCQGTPLRAEIEARAPGGLAAATAHAAKALAARHGDGEITGPIQAVVVVATL